LPLVAGANPPGNLGDMMRAIKMGKYFSIGKAGAKKSVVWAEDVPSIFSILSEKGGIFNLTDGIPPTFKQLEQVFAKRYDKQVKSIPLFVAKVLAFVGDVIGSKFPVNSNRLKKITSDLTFDDSKARTELNWKPSSVLEKLSDAL
jgi:nucleoside-diphosphate-sugar epimerase